MANIYREFRVSQSFPITYRIRLLLHVAASQENLHASVLPYTDPSNAHYKLDATNRPSFAIHSYPLVPSSPAFPLLAVAPASITPKEHVHVDPYILSATNIAYTKSLEFLRRLIGPYYDLEKIWGEHILYVC